ncbi:hypothetical protein [Vibrio alginolyticus]|uniref:hypothetical protein n=1 Tax=Vibrio alginolyticus TaxID=663 RepID=UPI000B0B73AC|nr:hypothetical protein [Vibrio alginolyticus]CAH7233016.1 conserved hypothetical protein [Vibrio chagasii]
MKLKKFLSQLKNIFTPLHLSLTLCSIMLISVTQLQLISIAKTQTIEQYQLALALEEAPLASVDTKSIRQELFKATEILSPLNTTRYPSYQNHKQLLLHAKLQARTTTLLHKIIFEQANARTAEIDKVSEFENFTFKSAVAEIEGQMFFILFTTGFLLFFLFPLPLMVAIWGLFSKPSGYMEIGRKEQ